MIRQLSVLVENKPGSLMEVTSRLTEAHVNIRAVANFDAPDFGILRMVVDKPEEAKKNITRLADRKIWDRLMTDTGMYTFMSSCQRDEWNSQLMSDTCPEITLDNVLATFRHLNASKMQTFERGLIDVYRKLSWDYRTNNPCRLGKKIIIEIFKEIKKYYNQINRFWKSIY